MTTQPLFDCHAHPDLFPLEDWKNLVVAAQRKGIHGCIAAGVWWDSLEPLLAEYGEWVVEKLTEREKFKALFLEHTHYRMFASLGLHPMEVALRWRNSEGQFDVIQAEADSRAMRDVASRCRNFIWAVGETGFDLAPQLVADWESKAELLRAQTYAFEKCAELANEFELPLIVHSRSGWAQTKQQLEKAARDSALRFMIHCFPGTGDDARWVQRTGGFASFGGVLTWSTARRMKDALKNFPSECLLFETDAPDLPPEFADGHRPRRNEPQYLVSVISEAASIRKCSERELVELNLNNVMQFFSLK